MPLINGGLIGVGPSTQQGTADGQELTLSYLAGFVDAFGFIGVIDVKGHDEHTIKIAITTRCNDVAILFQNMFGGQIHKKPLKNKKDEDCFEWSLTSSSAVRAIELLFPHLVARKEQAEICLRLDEEKKQTDQARYASDKTYKKARDKVYDKLKKECEKLNKGDDGKCNPHGN